MCNFVGRHSISNCCTFTSGDPFLCTMQSAPCRSRSRSRPKKLVPGRETTLGAFLRLLHTVGCPSTFLKIVYYVLIQKPINCDDLVDSLEVFSGEANYSKSVLCYTPVLTFVHILALSLNGIKRQIPIALQIIDLVFLEIKFQVPSGCSHVQNRPCASIGRSLVL